MDVASYTDLLNYLYELEHLNYLIIIILLVVCVILWVVLLLVPKINNKNKIGISFISITLIIIFSVCLIIQKQTTESILKDIDTEDFIEYEGDFEFVKSDPKQTGSYHTVHLLNEENTSLVLFDSLTQSDYSLFEGIIETGTYCGKIVYGANSRLIVYIDIEEERQRNSINTALFYVFYYKGINRTFNNLYHRIKPKRKVIML